MLNLRAYRDLLDTLDNPLAPKIIDKHIKDLFLELSGNFEWEFDRPFDAQDELWDYADLDEQYVSLDFDETLIPDNKMDVCIRIKFNINATQHREMDGGKFFENVSSDLDSIIFDMWGQEWDMSNDKDAIKFGMDVLNTYI